MTITLKVSETTKNKMLEFFQDIKREKTPNYAVFQAKDGDTVVTLYESGKAVFQGKDADLASDFWVQTEKINSGQAITTNSEEKKKVQNVVKNAKVYNACTVGSDEVGTGDYFGPVVVTSAYVTKENIPFLENLGVKDSKSLTDEKILEIVPNIIKKIPYECIVLSNKQYNEMYGKDLNLNKIKAILHNKVLFSLSSKYSDYDYIVIDEFTPKYVYYNYLKDIKNVQRNITFLTKAENQCLSVACASIISRFIFIKEFAKISNDLNLHLPKGSSNIVDNAGVKVVKQFGIEKLNEIAKLNFKNTEKIKDLIKKDN